MPPNLTSPQRRFDTSLLEPGALTTSHGLQSALSSVGSICYRDDSSIMEMIVGLTDRPHILEFIFSSTSYMPAVPMGLTNQTAPAALDDQAHERLSKWTIAQFPTLATINVMETLGVKLLQRLSSSLISVEGVSTLEHRNQLREFRKELGLSLNVLKELGRCADRTLVDAKVPPTNRKGPKGLARRTQLDPHPFDCMGVPVPTTYHKARVVCGEILPRLQNILRVRVSRPSGLTRIVYPVSALPACPEATSGLGCIQAPV